MRIAELSADHRYAALHHREAFAGNDDRSLSLSQLLYYDNPIEDVWIPPEVEYYEEIRSAKDDGSCSRENAARSSRSARPLGDFPHYWGINYGVLTERSFNALHELISPYVEFLPLLGPAGQFTAFKVLRFVDALDCERSVIEWYRQLKREVGKPKVARQIRKYVFKEEFLRNEVIFRLPQMPLDAPIFVTHAFMDVVHAHGLTGFKFIQVWPPLDERQKYREKRQRKRGNK